MRIFYSSIALVPFLLENNIQWKCPITGQINPQLKWSFLINQTLLLNQNYFLILEIKTKQKTHLFYDQNTSKMIKVIIYKGEGKKNTTHEWYFEDMEKMEDI